jgi:hypothetical protein
VITNQVTSIIEPQAATSSSTNSDVKPALGKTFSSICSTKISLKRIVGSSGDSLRTVTLVKSRIRPQMEFAFEIKVGMTIRKSNVLK